MTSTIRVRQLLSALNGVETADLKKLLPPKLTVPEEPAGTKYPAALLAQLADAAPTEQYSLAGYITEDLMGLAPADITDESLCSIARERCPALTEIHLAKITKSKTTEPYLAHIRETRKKLRFAARGDFRAEEEVGTGRVRGHPDLRTPTQVFEIKMTGRLKENWQDFLFQVFAYAALASEVTDLYLVLPLQEIIWHYDVTTWAKRAAYATYLETAAGRKEGAKGPALNLIKSHAIGSHMPKLKTLAATIDSLPLDCPSQIFLSGPQSSHLNVAAEDIEAARTLIQESGRQVFIHSPYLINLCTIADATNEAYHTQLLIKNLKIGVAMGARGIVVHVGKSTTQTVEAALATMKINLVACLEHATVECPILLETPAGQGTEVLTRCEAFAAFVAEINDARLRICIDTCHVFSAGEHPVVYMDRIISEHPELLRLIHFNDSAKACGACLDRHAFIGEGHIGFPTMMEIANKAKTFEIPMVIE